MSAVCTSRCPRRGKEIEKVARSHGWDLSGIDTTELIPSENNLSSDAQLTVFNPSEMELGETTEALIGAVNKHKPQRLVIDSLSELRLIAQNPLRYRRQVLALKQFFGGHACTVLMLDDRTGGIEDDHLQSIAHGVVLLEQLANQYGAERRRLARHQDAGCRVSWRLPRFRDQEEAAWISSRASSPPNMSVEFADENRPSGNPQLDGLLGGGLPTGTSTLLLGPAGTGKSSVATQFAAAAAARGERVAMFVFDENIGTFRSRSRKLGLGIEKPMSDGLITVQQVDPAELSSGEFAAIVRRAAEGKDASGKPAQHDHCRQSQRLSQRDARGKVPHRATARAAVIPGSTRAS